MSAVIFQIQSSIIVMMLVFGIYNNKKRNLHVKTMMTAIIWDILLVLQIELTRGAIKKASQAPVNPMILNIHVALAITTVLLYFFMVYSGLKMLKNNGNRDQHKRAGLATFCFRIATYLTSFWAV